MFVRVGFRPGYPEVAPSNATFSAITSQGGDAYAEGHPATQVHAALAPLDTEPVIVKRRVSAFSGSDLDMLLRGAQADALVLAGIACADRDPEVHRVLTEKVFPRQAQVTTADEWIASL